MTNKRKSLFILIIIILISNIFVLYAASNIYYCKNCGRTIEAADRFEQMDLKLAQSKHVNFFNHPEYNGVKCSKKDVVIYSQDAVRSFEARKERFANLSDEDKEKVGAISNFQTFTDMIADIFSVTDYDSFKENGETIKTFSVYNILKKVASACSKIIDQFNRSSLYSLFVFIGFLFLFINFSIDYYNSSYNSDGRTLEQNLKLGIKLIVSLFIIVNVSAFSKFLINFFIYVLDFVWKFTQSGTIVIDEGLTSSSSALSTAENISYTILMDAGCIDESLTGIVTNSFSSIGLTIKFFVPWLCSIVGNLGVMFAIFKCSFEILAYGFFYPIAAGDITENLRTSNFMRYTKHLLSAVLKLSIIVVILLIAQTLTKSFFTDIKNDALSAGGKTNYFELAAIAGVLQISKFVACNSLTDRIASSIAG